MFTVGALVFSLVMGCVSYFTVRHFLISERVNTSTRQAYVNGSLLLQLHPTSRDQIESFLDQADAGTAAHSVLELGGTWYGRSLSFGKSSLPAELRNLSASGTPATQIFDLGGSPVIAVGVPIPALHSAYFQVFDAGDLNHTLQVLALAMFAGGLITTLLGALVGLWASERSLRPLAGVSRAAVAIAGGRLGTRLEAGTDDPDLEGLTMSFNLMVDQLQERIEREARFTSDVSHELRSPLTTLLASLEVLEADAERLTPRAQEALRLLSADVRRFQRMVDELLEISRFDAGSAELALEEVDAGELVRRSVGAAVRTQHLNGRPPTVDVHPDLEEVRLLVDKRRFERIMANLLENAANYGGGATRVTARRGRPDSSRLSVNGAAKGEAGRLVSSRRNGHPVPGSLSAVHGTILVSVEDHGSGVAPAERLRIFERFYRGQAAGQRGAGTGTGLGLALVAEHVRLHGGAVWVDQAEGGGARFTIELPVAEETGEGGP